jgi:PEP-CTERM motif
MRLCRKSVFPLAVLVAMLASSAVGRADIILGTEDPVTGFVGPYIAGFPAYSVASDGEVPFDPFHAGFDTSDGITFASGLNWAPGNAATAAAWLPVVDPTGATDIWVLPAHLENEPPFETPGFFISPVPWNVPPVVLGTYVILEADGTVSDKLVLSNAMINGVLFATATMYSDPIVPEPSTMVIFGLGAAALAALRLRKKPA